MTISCDPSEQEGTRSYVYAGDGPAERSDPSGLGECAGEEGCPSGLNGSMVQAGAGGRSAEPLAAGTELSPVGEAALSAPDAANASPGTDPVALGRVQAAGLRDNTPTSYQNSNGQFVNGMIGPGDPAPVPVESYAVRFDGSRGKWVTVSDRGTVRSATGKFIYVVSNGVVRVSRRLVAQQAISHQDLTMGEPVDYAGEVQFSGGGGPRGMLRWWNNRSGHYLPNALAARGVGAFPQDAFRPEVERDYGAS